MSRCRFSSTLWLLAGLSGLLVWLNACGGASPPTLNAAIVDGKTVAPGAELTLQLTLNNFQLAPKKLGKAHVDGEGHVRVYLDDAQGDSYLYQGGDNPIPITLPADIAEGTHTFRILLQQNNYIQYKPATEIRLQFTVSNNALASITATLEKKTAKPAEPVKIKVSTQNFTLQNFLKDGKNRPKVPGFGHYHVYLGDRQGSDYLVADFRPETSIVLPANTKPGTYKIRVQLRNNDHTPVTPVDAATAELSLTIVDANQKPPTLQAKLAKTTIETDEEVELSVTLANFTLDANNLGKGNKPGFGHYNVYLDENKGKDTLAVGTSPKLQVRIPAATSPGKHRIRVQLMNNDRTPLSPAVESTIDITVTEGQPKIIASLNVTQFFATSQPRLSISVRNFKVDKTQIGEANKAGVGHYRVYLDNKKDKDFLVQGDETLQLLKFDSNINAGLHFLRIALHQNDGRAVRPAVETTIEFKISEEALPTLQVSGPQGSVEAGKAFTISVQSKGFQFDAKAMGKTNAFRVGHYRIYLDDKKDKDFLYEGTEAKPSLTLPDKLAAGTYELRVSLRHNDGTPFTPRVEQKISFPVKASTKPKLSAKADKQSIKRGQFLNITLTLDNFILDKKNIGGKPVAGRGHFHVYLNDKTGTDYILAGADTTAIVPISSKTPLGKNKLHVILQNNNHTEYKPRTVATIEITVLK